jgi:hypothetical protein
MSFCMVCGRASILWGDSRIMAAAPLLSGYGYLGSIGVMMPTFSSISAAASRHRSSR